MPAGLVTFPENPLEQLDESCDQTDHSLFRIVSAGRSGFAHRTVGLGRLTDSDYALFSPPESSMKCTPTDKWLLSKFARLVLFRLFRHVSFFSFAGAVIVWTGLAIWALTGASDRWLLISPRHNLDLSLAFVWVSGVSWILAKRLARRPS